MSVGLQVWSQTASANSTIDTNIAWPEGMAPSQVNDSARAMMASAAKWRDDNNGSIVTSGTTTAYTVTTSQVEASLTAGYTVAFQMHATNDSSATLAVDGLTAKPLQVTAGSNLAGGELLIGNSYRATYSTSGTGQWIIQGADALGSQPNIVSTVNLSTNAVTYAKFQQAAASSIIANPTTSAANVQAVTLGTNLSFSGTVLNAGNNVPIITVITSTATATWQSTTQNGNFPLYLHVRMVGPGGGGAATNTNSGSSGVADTSFGSWTAGSGFGGALNGAGGNGGSGGATGTGTLITRVSGGSGGSFAGSGEAGGGGVSFYGGAPGPVPNSTTKSAAANSGSGGAGAGQQSGGGAGEYVEFIVTSPSTSYVTQVGPGGAGGAAGGTAGGNGGAGRIEVIAYWQ